MDMVLCEQHTSVPYSSRVRYCSEFDFDLSALSVGPIIEKPRLHCACCVKIIYTKRIPRYGIIRYHTSTYFYQHVRCDL
jgi:hypothetical protein